MTTTSITSIRMPIVRCSIVSSRSTASAAPVAAPRTEGITTLAALTRGIASRLRNVATETSDCTRMPTRLVPLATFAGKPSTIKSGSVMSEPLPASVLM